ncbi:MAG: ABC transporter substrate-binding protein [Phycisphaerales bacterium JB040]
MTSKLLIAVLLFVVAPGHAPAGEDLRVVDDADRVVELQSHATRVAVVAPFGNDLLARLGVEPVAAPTLPGGVNAWPEHWERTVPLRVTHAAGPSLEQLVACAPDLVLSTSAYAHAHDTIERVLGVPVVTLDTVSLDDFPRHLETLGVLLGREEEAASAARTYRETLAAALASEPSGGARKTRVLAIFGGARSFYGFLPDSYVGSVLEALGCELTTGGLDSHAVFTELTPLSLEHALASDPDVVLVLGHGQSAQTARTILNDRAWGALRAVREGRVVGLPDELFVTRPGTEPERAVSSVRAAIEAD